MLLNSKKAFLLPSVYSGAHLKEELTDLILKATSVWYGSYLAYSSAQAE